MADYKVTDTELTAVANAIRTKGGTSELLEWPNGFISAIQAIPTPGPTIVSWATGTDEEIVAMIQAAHNGEIDLQEDGGWAVGDVRSISVASFNANDGYTTRNYDQQFIDIVITSFNDYNNCGCVMQFDFKDSLGTKAYVDYYSRVYEETAMYKYTLPALVNALPSWLSDLLLEFDVIGRDLGSSSSTHTITGNKLAIRGTSEVRSGSSPSEGALLEYYNASASNRIKTLGHGGNADSWLLRTVSTTGYAVITSDGSGSFGSRLMGGVAPFGCI